MKFLVLLTRSKQKCSRIDLQVHLCAQSCGQHELSWLSGGFPRREHTSASQESLDAKKEVLPYVDWRELEECSGNSSLQHKVGVDLLFGQSAMTLKHRMAPQLSSQHVGGTAREPEPQALSLFSAECRSEKLLNFYVLGLAARWAPSLRHLSAVAPGI